MDQSLLEGHRVSFGNTNGVRARQRSRRYCLAGSVGFIVLIIVGVVFLQKLKLFTLQYTNPATEAGESAGAQAAARVAARHFPNEVLKAMDLSVDPCSDFYSYACGQFQAITELEPDQNEWARSWSGVSARNNELLREVVETDHGIAGTFYRSCLNMTQINLLGSKPLQPFLAKLREVRGCTEAKSKPFSRLHKYRCGAETLTAVIVKWQQIDIKVFFDWSVEVNPHDPTKYALNLMQDGITLPDPKWYYSGTAEAQAKLAALRKVAKKVLELAGQAGESAMDDAAAAVEFEGALARLFRDATEERTTEQGEYTLDQLAELAPNLYLPEVLKALAGEHAKEVEKTTILIRNPAYFKGVSELLLKTPASHLRAYLKFRVAFILGADMSQEFLDVGQELQMAVVGQKTSVPRWYKCFKSVDHALPDYLGKIFVQRFFSQDIMHQATDMLLRLRDVFQEELLDVTWMQPDTKSAATHKLADMLFSVGFPPTFADYSSLKLTGDFVADGDILYGWYIAHAFERLARPVQRDRWGTTSPALADAFYSYDKNVIFVPAGILQQPFFSTTFREARNYGAIGTILGHEISHGFDDQGRKFDPKGRLAQWWTEEDVVEFEERTRCVEALYSAFQYHGKKVNGALTLGENVADIAGVKLAYNAMARVMREKEGGSAPSLTDRQLFFVAQGQNWCTKEREEAEELQLLTDPHAPDRFRVNGPLSQVESFAEAFQCPAGSPMNPLKRCDVW